jgi:integrase
MTIRTLLKRYAAYRLERNLRTTTLANARGFDRWFAQIAGRRPIESFTTKDLRTLRKQGVRRDRLEMVMAVFRWAWRQRLTSEDITRGAFVRPLNDETRVIKFLKAEHAHRYLDAILPEHKAAFILALFAGLRPWEICRLKWGAIKMDDLRIDIPAAVSKTRRGRHFHAEVKKYWRLTLFGRTAQVLRDTTAGVPKLLFELLKPYERGPEEYVFLPGVRRNEKTILTRIYPELWRERRRAAQASGVQLSHDVFRHTFLTYLVALTGDMACAAEIAGHESFRMLRRHYLGKATRRQAEIYFRRPITMSDEPDIVDFPLPPELRRALKFPPALTI